MTPIRIHRQVFGPRPLDVWMCCCGAIVLPNHDGIHQWRCGGASLWVLPTNIALLPQWVEA